MSSEIQKPNHYFNAPRREMLQFVPRNVENILEIGCGEGRFSAVLKEKAALDGLSITVTGIEIDPQRAEVAKGFLDVIYVGDVEDNDFYLVPDSYDCIICNDVLEHLKDPWKVLAHAHSLLKPGGYIVGSIPNVRYWGVLKSLLIEKEWRYSDEGVLDVTHFRFFTRASIDRMFKGAGYESIELTGINSFVSGWKFSLLNMFMKEYVDDIQFLQFSIVARKSMA